MKFLNNLLNSLTAPLQQDAQAAADSATQGFYIISGQLLIIIILLALLLYKIRK